MEKKTLGETRLIRGPVLLWPAKEQCVIRAALQDKLDRNIKSICNTYYFKQKDMQE